MLFNYKLEAKIESISFTKVHEYKHLKSPKHLRNFIENRETPNSQLKKLTANLPDLSPYYTIRFTIKKEKPSSRSKIPNKPVDKHSFCDPNPYSSLLNYTFVPFQEKVCLNKTINICENWTCFLHIKTQTTRTLLKLRENTHLFFKAHPL